MKQIGNLGALKRLLSLGVTVWIFAVAGLTADTARAQAEVDTREQVMFQLAAQTGDPERIAEFLRAFPNSRLVRALLSNLPPESLMSVDQISIARINPSILRSLPYPVRQDLGVGLVTRNSGENSRRSNDQRSDVSSSGDAGSNSGSSSGGGRETDDGDTSSSGGNGGNGGSDRAGGSGGNGGNATGGGNGGNGGGDTGGDDDNGGDSRDANNGRGGGDDRAGDKGRGSDNGRGGGKGRGGD